MSEPPHAHVVMLPCLDLSALLLGVSVSGFQAQIGCSCQGNKKRFSSPQPGPGPGAHQLGQAALNVTSVAPAGVIRQIACRASRASWLIQSGDLNSCLRPCCCPRDTHTNTVIFIFYLNISVCPPGFTMGQSGSDNLQDTVAHSPSSKINRTT